MASAFGPHLIRVIKNVRKKGASGQTKVVRQAYYVKAADPGDQYAHLTPDATQNAADGAEGEAPGGGEAEGAPPPEEQQEPTVRMAVAFHDIPWKTKIKGKPEKDAIPDEVRSRFDSKNRHLRPTTPVSPDVSTITVDATDSVLWGVDEKRLTHSLKTGFLDRLKFVGCGKGIMPAVIKDDVAGSYEAILWMDELREPLLSKIWGKLISKEGDYPAYARHAAAYYEIAKSCGLDGLVSPTVRRVDQRGDLYHLLPDGLVESREAMVEWVARATGKSPDDVRRRAGGASAVHYKKGSWHSLVDEPWYSSFFSNSSSDRQRSEFAEEFWNIVPPATRLQLLRITMLDFIAWNTTRSFLDLMFCDDERFPLLALGNELSVPCPRAQANEYVASSYKTYGEAMEDVASGTPLMLSDLAVRLSVRGSERELADFEEIAHIVTDRMVSDDRPVELCRSLFDMRLPPCHVGAVLARLWLSKTHAKDIARDPYMAIAFFSGLRAGQKQPEMEGVVEFVNKILSKAMVKKFDFVKEMKSDKDDPPDKKSPEEEDKEDKSVEG